MHLVVNYVDVMFMGNVMDLLKNGLFNLFVLLSAQFKNDVNLKKINFEPYPPTNRKGKIGVIHKLRHALEK